MTRPGAVCWAGLSVPRACHYNLSQMRKFKISIITISAIIIAAGAYWGWERNAQQRSPKPESQVYTLRILALKDLIPRKLIERFEQKTAVKIELTEAENPEELWHRLDSSASSYDIVSLISYQVPLAAQMSKIIPIEPKRLVGFSSISPDFIRIPGGHGHADVIPILWGINGFAVNASEIKSEPTSWRSVFQDPSLRQRIGLISSAPDLQLLSNLLFPESKPSANETAELKKNISAIKNQVSLSNTYLSPLSLFREKPAPLLTMISHGESSFLPKEENGKEKWVFVYPEEKGLLWIISFAKTSEAKSQGYEYAFLDFMLEPESALQISKNNRQATTSRDLEAMALDSRLKASYFREIPLTSYSFWQDYSRAQEIRALLSPPTAGSSDSRP